jgi:hypothetical protein
MPTPTTDVTSTFRLTQPTIGNFVSAIKNHGLQYKNGNVAKLGETVGLALDQLVNAIGSQQTITMAIPDITASDSEVSRYNQQVTF